MLITFALLENKHMRTHTGTGKHEPTPPLSLASCTASSGRSWPSTTLVHPLLTGTGGYYGTAGTR